MKKFLKSVEPHVTGSDLYNRALSSWAEELGPIAEAKLSGIKC
jgi:hypothetical protein